MRLFRCLAALSAVILLAGCKPGGPKAETQWRFVGGDVLAQQTNAPVLSEVLQLKESAPTGRLLVTNVARLLWRLTTAEDTVPARVLEPGVVIADHLLSHLSVGQSFRGAGGKRDWAVAFQADGEAANLMAAWTNYFGAANPGAQPAAEISGKWLIAVSDARLIKPAAALRTLALIPAEAGEALRLDLAAAEHPAVSLVATLRDGAVRTTAKVTLAEKIPALPAWELPELIRDPLVQFTASRWPQPLVEHLPLLKELLGGEPVSQVFVWGQAGLSFQTFVAARSDRSTNIMDNLLGRLRKIYEVPPGEAKFAGRLVLETNFSRLSLHSMPVVLPAAGPVRSAGRDYFFVRFFPEQRSTNQMPVELRQQFDRPGVAYYDWEISGEAVKHWSGLDQVRDMVTRQRLQLHGNPARWLVSASAKLDNSITEGLVTGERELTLTRRSPVGLSALELTALMRWLGASEPASESAPALMPGVQRR
jgi:hypothetical protein